MSALRTWFKHMQKNDERTAVLALWCALCFCFPRGQEPFLFVSLSLVLNLFEVGSEKAFSFELFVGLLDCLGVDLD
jgi:hypothetical protein